MWEDHNSEEFYSVKIKSRAAKLNLPRSGISKPGDYRLSFTVPSAMVSFCRRITGDPFFAR